MAEFIGSRLSTSGSTPNIPLPVISRLLVSEPGLLMLPKEATKNNNVFSIKASLDNNQINRYKLTHSYPVRKL
jgi:hypothetical protein